MKANEVRIGNWVNKSLKSRSGRVLQDKIGPADIQRIYEDVGSFNYKPIPLTEDWLIRFGFEKDKENVYLSPYETAMNDDCFTRMCFDFVEDKMFIVNSNAYDGFHVECNYVHQLQNLYFALTGEELKLTDQ